MKKKIVLLALVLTIFIAPAVFAVSSNYFAKATLYYNNICNRPSLTNVQSLRCYLYDKVLELDTTLQNHENRISSLENSPGKKILDYAQYQTTEIWTTTESTDAATPTQVQVNCPVNCVLHVNYWADNRTNTLQTDPGQAQAYQIIYVDGVRSNNYTSAVFRTIGDPLMVSTGGLFPVGAGQHTVQIYAWQHYGTLDIRERVLTAIAFEQ